MILLLQHVVNVSPSTVPAVVPKSTSVFPNVTLSFTNLLLAIDPANRSLVTPAAFTLNASDAISIDESSTFTTNSPFVTPIPAPSTVVRSKPTPSEDTSTPLTLPVGVEVFDDT